jgi:hypothetical protein
MIRILGIHNKQGRHGHVKKESLLKKGLFGLKKEEKKNQTTTRYIIRYPELHSEE